jgi:hypothetical protein
MKLRNIYSENIQDRRSERREGDDFKFIFINPRAEFWRSVPPVVPPAEDVGALGEQAGFSDIGKPQFLKPAPDGISQSIFDGLSKHSDEVRSRVLDVVGRKNGNGGG